MLEKVSDSFKYAFRGLCVVWREEHNFRIEVLASLIVLFYIFYFRFSHLESALLIFAITTVLLSEIANTAVEDICNKIEPNEDEAIGKIKDVMAGFVFVSCVGASIVGFLVFCNHFLY